ncbi:aminoacyl--tRNA ligase-related protein [Paenibacillus oryzisoli]|uniref:aminoacyl--tRNA ligase-related protein n=1 Tax=Paenibacillus oryzisoli TaxID=1850517 RepID=UPI003D2B3B24
MEKKYATQGILTAMQAESLVSKLMYSVEGISNCYLDTDSQEIVVHTSVECDLALLENTIGQMMEWEKHHRIIKPRMYKESETSLGINRKLFDVDDVFVEDGSIRRNFAVQLFEKLDTLFLKLAYRHEAKLRKYPSMIPLQTLDKCKYITSFPQNIHLVSEIPHQLEVLKQVKEKQQIDEIARLSSYALSPAVCFHCYEELTGSRLDQPLVLTANGTCYRHEAPWRLGKHRLKEFSMREIVVFGDAEYVEALRKFYMEEVWGLFESLGLQGKIETASDPFYFSEDVAKSQHQLMGNMKYELIVSLGTEAFSITSFNHMSDTLTKPFNVCDRDHNYLNSGCIAFGIDRWVYALLRTYGPEFNQWPQEIQSLLS